MTLKVWRKKGTLFAECTTCGCYGSAGHLKTGVRMDPEIADALEQHTARMLTMREHFKKAVEVLQRKLQLKEMTPVEAQNRFRELSANHVAQVTTAAALLPSPDGKVTTFAAACPWCDDPAQVDIEVLANDAEPPFELVKLVVQAQKGKGG